MAELRSGTTIGGYVALHLGLQAIALPGSLSVASYLSVLGTGVFVAAGSAGAPAISFNADQTTGIYREAANTLGIATGGLARVTISTSALNLAGIALNVGGTTVLSSARVLQNVTADAAIITAGTLADGRLSTNVALKANSNTFSQQQTVARALATDASLVTYVTGDTTARWAVRASGNLEWGSGGAGGTDTNLYRAGVGSLATNGAFSVAGNFSVSGAVTLPANSIADTALSANVALKNAVGTWTVGQMVNRLKHLHGNITSAEYDGVGAGGYGAYQASAYSNGSSTFIGNFFHYTALHAVYADLGAGAGYGFYTQGAYASPVIQILGTSGLSNFAADTPVKTSYRYQVISATVTTPQTAPIRITNTNATWLFGVNSNNAFELGNDLVVGGLVVLTAARVLQNVSINAVSLKTGTLDDARLSTNVPLKDATNDFTGTNIITRAAGGSTALAVRVTGDAGYRVFVQADGRVVFGDGAGVYDTNLYRSAADTLKTDDSLAVTGALTVGAGLNISGAFGQYSGAAAGDIAHATSITTDTQRRFILRYSGDMNWGPGGTTTTDVTLSRSAANTLTLTGALAISANLTVTNGILQNGFTVPYGVSSTQNPGSYMYGSPFYDNSADATYGRSVDRPPSHYQKTMLAEFKSRTALGFLGAATYMGTLTLGGYSDSSGGNVVGQLGWVGQTLGWRSGTAGSSTWSAWQQVLLLNSDGSATLTTGGFGVGTSTGGTTGLRVSGTLSWLTTANNYALFSDVTFPATATTSGVAGYFRASTAAAAFTMGAAHGVYVASTGAGAGSTITTNYAIYVQDQTAATNNYALFTGVGMVRLGDRVGIGSVPLTNSALTVDLGTLTGTSQYGVRATPNLTAAATTVGVALLTQVRTAAAAFTMPSAYSIYVQGPSVGAGSTITTNFGLYIESQTQGTTNYSLYTNSGIVRFGDRVGIGTTAASVTQLHVSGAHTSTATSIHGALFDVTMPATATVTAEAARFRVVTAAAAFTLSAGVGIRIADATKGAGSSITNQYGLWIDAQTQGTANYAIYTNAGAVRFGDSVTVSNGSLATVQANNTDWSLIASVTGDSTARFAVRSNGSMEWGPGGAAARDTTLSRSAAGVLSLTGTFAVSGNVLVEGILTAGTVKLGDMSYGTGWAGLVHKDTAAQNTNYALITNQAGTDTRLNVATGGTIFMYVNSATVLAQFSATATQLGVNGGAVIVGASDIGGTEVLRVNGTTKSTGVSATSSLTVAGRNVGGQIISTAAPSGTAPDGTVWYQV